jgi:regulatory protein
VRENRPSKPAVKRKVPKKLSESYLRNSALYYLQRHPTSVAHFLEVMDRKMKRSMRAHPEQDLTPFTAFLKEKLVPDFMRAGFLNDELYAQALAGSLRRKGLPRRAIQMRLKMKGVEAPEVLDDHDDLKAAYIFAKRKRLGPFAKKARDPQKDLSALARAGFSYDVCKQVIQNDAQSAEEFFG